MTTSTDPTRGRRIELILREIDAIPTPSPIAVRLLSLASDEDVEISAVVGLIESDPGLTARLLGLCRRSTTGLGGRITTVDRAVVLLGLEAVRAMLLSVDIHEFMVSSRHEDVDDADDSDPGGAPTARSSALDRVELWRHALAVACAAERIVQTHADQLMAHASLKPEEAFVCGLLHDIGKVALDLLLPRAFVKVVRLAQRRCEPLAKVEKSLLGIDHTMVGKRLAEGWGLPEIIRDVIWLHGRPAKAIPDLHHKRLIGAVSAANELARLMHVGESGNAAPPSSIDRIAMEWNFDAARLEQVAVTLHERVSQRSAQLGMDEAPPAELLAQSLAAANRTLVHLNDIHRRRMKHADQLESVVRAMQLFSDQITDAQSPVDTMRAVVRCGQSLFGGGEVVSLILDDAQSSWSVCRYDEHGRIQRAATAELRLNPAELLENGRSTGRLHDEALQEISRTLQWMPVNGGFAHKVLVLHAAESLGALLLHTWRMDRERGVAIAAWRVAMASAIQQARSNRLVEEVTELNSELLLVRERAAEAETYARVGELTAGAAHEMNNPLAVISARAQLLLEDLAPGVMQEAAGAIVQASSRLSRLVEGLHFVASPPPIRRQPVDLTEKMPSAIKQVRARREKQGLPSPAIRFTVCGALPPALVDPELFSAAVQELLANALEAEDSHQVELHIQTEETNDRLIVSVRDDGRGIPPQIVAHIADPFYSSKSAGRSTGMGLARTRRIVELHGGRLQFLNRSERGTEARITLDVWRPEHISAEMKAA